MIAGLGLLFELPVLIGEAPVPALPRPDAVALFDAMGSGQQPAWTMILYLILGATGALLAGSSGRGRRKTA